MPTRPRNLAAVLALLLVLAVPAAAGPGPQVDATIAGTVTLTLDAATVGNEAGRGDYVDVPPGPRPFALLFTHYDRDQLLDYTNPARPTVKQAGVYSFSASVVCQCDDVRAGALMIVVGLGDSSHDQVIPREHWPFARASAGVNDWRVEAGDPVQVLVFNGTGRTLPIDVELATLSKSA